jgi:alginate O-acetyltransferase complex protein AlgI
MALYVFFFPTYIAGPVDRFQRFHPQTEEKKNLNSADINNGLFRIISGMIKKFVISDSLTPVIMPVLTSPHDYSPTLLILSIYGLAIRLYMDFSGYTDMALGVSRLFGYKIMENFNWPFLKKNIALFWRNWHISVYSFIRDYFFFPLFGHRASQLKIYIGILITMVVFMLWHEASLPWLSLGLYHGSGLVVWQLFQELKRKHVRLRKAVDNRYVDPFSTFLTFNFVSFGFLMFTFDFSTISVMLGRMF